MQTESFGTAPEKAPFTVSPTLPAEANKPPWRPNVVGRIAFFFGPIAAALVAIISLRRMDFKEKASTVVRVALAAAVVESVILFFVPEGLSRGVGIGSEIAFYMLFPFFLQKEFQEWQTAHHQVEPSSGWKAIGWGFIGAIAFLAIVVVVMVALSFAFPGAQ